MPFSQTHAFTFLTTLVSRGSGLTSTRARARFEGASVGPRSTSMRACGALACAARAHGAAVVVCYKWGLLTACVLVPLLQGGIDQERGPGALGLVTPFALRALRALCFVVIRAASPRCWWRGFAAVLVARLRRGVGGAASPRCWLRGFAAN